MAVVRQLAIESIGYLTFSSFDGNIIFHAIVFPKRNRAFYQVIPGSHTGFTYHQSRRELRLCTLCGPSYDFFSSIKTNVRFRHSEIRMRFPCFFVSIVKLAVPRTVRQNFKSVGLAIEQQSCLPATFVRETVFTEIPHQDSNAILALCQIFGNVYMIVIGILRIRSSFQTAFEHHHFTVYP